MVQHNSIDHTGITGVGASYGSNSNSVASANAPGASTLASRADHVHLGVRSITHTSNTFSGPVTLTAQGIIGITSPSSGTLAINAVAGAAAGGSGITQAYVGYNTIGATSGAATANRVYAKKVTLANDCLITSVSMYVKQNTAGATLGFASGLWTDNAGAPQYLVAGSNVTSFLQETSGVAGAARWVHCPLGIWVVAGDYWIGMQLSNASHDVYSDTSGTDRHWTPNSFSQLADYGTVYTPTITTVRYSLRASTVR